MSRKRTVWRWPTFRTWKQDFYSFSVTLSYWPGYWIECSLWLGKWACRWEIDL